MTLYRVTAQSLEVLSVSAANIRVTAQALEVLTGTYQIRMPKSYALAVLDDGSLPSYDPYFSNVVLLLHADGANNSTTITDSSSSAKTVTPSGNAKISTAASKFGGSSLLLDGTDDYCVLADSNDWNFGSGQFTIEAWLNFTSGFNTDANVIVSQWASGSRAFVFDWFSNTLRFSYSTDGLSTTGTITGSWTPTAGTWYHVAVDRDVGNTLRLYVNGAVVGSASLAVTFANSAAQLYVGRIETSIPTNDYMGYLDDLRITKGTARYGGGTFAVPLAAFPDSGAPVTATRRRPVVALLG